MVKDKEESLVFPDDGFPDRVLKTSLFLSAIVIICSLSYVSLLSTVSIAVGCFLSLVTYKTLWWTIRYGMQYKKSEMKKFFLQIGLLKYFTVGTVLFAACFFLDVNILAMTFGLGIVIIVIVLKMASRLLVSYMNTSIKVPFKDRNV
jgi:hypothetical protein